MPGHDLSRIPLATYRIQFNREFTFEQANGIVEYLAELGISDLYASPFFQAGPDSTHGYDICCFDKLNDNLGSHEDFEQLTRSLSERKMGLLLDMVPNHMGGYETNCWWQDVLKFGRVSKYASFFDINWNSESSSLKGKILLPVLGDRYDQVLQNGQLKLTFEKGEFWIGYFDKRFPLSPESLDFLPGNATEFFNAVATNDPAGRHALKQVLSKFAGSPGDANSWDALHELIKKQHYRLAFWRVAGEELNYRRFFDVTDLVALRVEDESVFKAAHDYLFELIGSGKVTGLRIDHPDGLREPKEYFERLLRRSKGLSGKLFVVVEKILSDDERLPEDWPVEGTTGYDFLNYLNGIFVRQESEEQFDQIYKEFTGCGADFAALASDCKRYVLEHLFASEFNQLSGRLKRIAEQTRFGVDFTLSELKSALSEFIARFPVYRTYVSDSSESLGACDQKHIEETLRACLSDSRNERIKSAIEFLSNLLFLKDYPDFTDELSKEAREFVLRFQQLSGPATAKGLEDTAFYRFNRLVSLNEVGGDPGRFGRTPQEFHEYNKYRLESWPHSLSATATHDTKRGEDFRARVNVLSEIPAEWSRVVSEWSDLNRKQIGSVGHQPAPSRNDEYLLYQTLVGSWADNSDPAVYRQRLQQYMVKAMREAKDLTSWTDPNAAYEAAVASFIEDIPGSEKFLKSFLPFQRKIAEFGYYNSLSQLVLKICCPGIPDFYQGTELWDFSLVDPDNRRAVDYTSRQKIFSRIKNAVESETSDSFVEGLFENLSSGAIKLFTLFRLLNFRRDHAQVFQCGEYSALYGEGPASEHIIAFIRSLECKRFVVAVPRHYASKLPEPKRSLIREFWSGTTLDIGIGSFRNIFTNKVNSGNPLKCEEQFSAFPVAVLEEIS